MSAGELSENARNAWRQVFLRYVGRGKLITFDDLADQAGVPAGTLRSIAAGDHSPRWEYAIRILSCLPQSAKDDVLKPLGIATRPLEGDGCDRRTTSTMARAVAKLTHALEDGKVDHLERADIEPDAREAYEEIGRWLNGTAPTVVTLVKEGKIS